MAQNDYLDRALADLGWSQNDLARRIGVHRNSVSAWARGSAKLPGPVRAYLDLVLRIKGLME